MCYVCVYAIRNLKYFRESPYVKEKEEGRREKGETKIILRYPYPSVRAKVSRVNKEWRMTRSQERASRDGGTRLNGILKSKVKWIRQVSA